MTDKKSKWDQRYSNRQSQLGDIAQVLKQQESLLPSNGRALDLACGLGSNSIFLAKHGFEVTAWDLSDVAIRQLDQLSQQLGIKIIAEARDCVRHPPPAESFDVILVARFLERALCPAISAALKPGGRLFYQTFTVHHQGSPSNPAFLLQEKELAQLFPDLQILSYQENGEAMFVAEKP